MSAQPSLCKWEEWLGIGAPNEQAERRAFFETYRIDEAGIAPWKLQPLKIAVAEWAHQLRAGTRAKVAVAIAQTAAPIAAAFVERLAPLKTAAKQRLTGLRTGR